MNGQQQEAITSYSLLWERLEAKLSRMAEQLADKVPHATKNGIYDSTRIDWWTSGFWPGMLWIMYDMTKQPQYKEWAWEWDIRLEQAIIAESNFHHDVGFQFLPTAVIKHKLTGDQDARRRGVLAATLLAGRYNPAGRFIRAWNQVKPTSWNHGNEGWSIIDSTMNLSLLFWASEETGDPRYAHIAREQANTVVEHFIRPDGSVRHICRFDPFTGEFMEALGGQGLGPESAWSRGAAWALHGMANTYRYTGDIRYLDAAKRVAHFFIASLEEDSIPLWDFRAAPERLETPATAATHQSAESLFIAAEPRDTSAASCAASGLLELADQVPQTESAVYRRSALRIIDSLTTRYAEWDDPNYEGILKEATGHRPGDQNINVSLIYGDYYYVEAAAKLMGWKNRIF
ncbi:glycosyl hydrolase [Paenibacillus glucanolyticus]|jgi:unsaturated chondroitin disaccharide hydrolase|uniref:glycoside hydrolase family 88 protein n=1 Tax=Paenibacillus TaxID=44249 RepID=UPI0003E25DA9|nr:MULTISPECIES: glycoside hydrolase family 88 protein [Paenibacillus]ANA82706.1 glycosyl hydrolase [Paenibacillus glucanolyticus]AVV58211.1 glycosyl hydrolase [Paenibacillus glucanolyticus]ETT42969.1 glycoside hydrolase family protein [Paenibacillus sp. FSL R5-808]